MSEDKTTQEDWTPAVTLELYSATGHGFAEVEERFKQWAKTQPVPELAATTGWVQITPQRAEAWLLRNAKNRKANFPTIQAYAVQITNGEWKKTGQPIIFTDEGVLLDGQHRLWACYLCNLPIDSFVVTEVPHQDALFAFIDNVRPRSGADALYIAGVNGMANHVSVVIKQLAWRWDQGMLRIYGRAPMPEMSNREILGYVQEHPTLVAAAKLVEGNYKSATKRLAYKPVASFLAWKIIELYGEETLDRFMSALVSRELLRLPDGHPVAALQKRLDAHEKAKASAKSAAARQDQLPMTHVLALAIKAFNLMQTGGRTKRLVLATDEPFPQFIDPSEVQQQAEAAE